MPQLIIDTSSEYTLMGIAQDRKILASQIALHSNQLSQTLIPTLQRLLQEANVTLKDLREIAVGVGPGSYTGTRVGVAVAKSLSFSLKISHLRGFCSLLTLIPPEEGTVAAVMPSKTGDFYLLKGFRSEDKLTCLQSDLVSRETLIQAIADVDILIGKPLKEFERLQGNWIQSTPSLESIIVYLQTAQEPLSVDLIYLHTP